MIITNVKEKLEQIERLMDKKGFYLLMPNDCDTLQDIANSWGSSEYDKYHWHDLTYVKHYGKNSQHRLCITLGTTKKLFHLKGKLFVSHLDISKMWFGAGDRLTFDKDTFEEELKELDKIYIYLIDAISDCSAIRKALNKISSYTER